MSKTRLIAWVTGGGTGIGKALAEALFDQGFHLAISGRRKDVLEQTARQIESRKEGQAKGSEVLVLPGDVGDAGTVTRSYQKIHDRWGDVNWMINNAGSNPYHSFQQATPQEFEENFRANCLSAILCTKAVLPGMLARKSGAIVNVSSIIGKWASGTSSAYSVSKHAMTGFTEALRQDLIGSGIQVMGVYPGLIRTAMTEPFTKSSFRQAVAKPPEAMASAILSGLRKHKRDVYYPWYVSWLLRGYRLFPGFLDQRRKTYGR
jgi:short-subunit dehydrogenase